ncbi:hypothetical protein Efla_007855 [Eimeria flavescens]
MLLLGKRRLAIVLVTSFRCAPSAPLVFEHRFFGVLLTNVGNVMCAFFCVPQADPQTDTDFSESPPRTPATLDLDASPLGAVTEPETFRQSVVPANSPLLPAPTPGSHFYSSSPASDDGGSISGQSAYTQSPSPSADSQTDTDFSESPPRTPATPDLDAGPLAAMMEAVWPIAALSHSGTKICAKSCNYGSMSSTEILSCFYDILPTYEIVVG